MIIRRIENIKGGIVLRHSILLLFALTLLMSCENDLKTVNYYTAKSNAPSLVGENIEMIYSERGRILAKMKTPVLNNYMTEKSYLEMPKGVTLFFYDSVMAVQSQLDAKYAIKRDKEQVMEARNNVVVVNRKGEVLNTEHLVWDEKSEKIYSDVFVKITTKDEIIFGEGFESDQYFEKWVLKKPKGVITIKK